MCPPHMMNSQFPRLISLAEDEPPRLDLTIVGSVLLLLGIILLVWYLIIRQRSKEAIHTGHEAEHPVEGPAPAPQEGLPEKGPVVVETESVAAVSAATPTPEELTPSVETIPTEPPEVEPAAEAAITAAEIAQPIVSELAPVETVVETPVVEPVVVPEKVAEVIPPQVDDLEIIEGIGPKIAGLLNEAGITTFAQLAKTEVSRLVEILTTARLRIADPSTWPEQARLAAAGKLDELQAFQATLKGGRQVGS